MEPRWPNNGTGILDGVRKFANLRREEKLANTVQHNKLAYLCQYKAYGLDLVLQLLYLLGVHLIPLINPSIGVVNVSIICLIITIVLLLALQLLKFLGVQVTGQLLKLLIGNVTSSIELMHHTFDD